MLPLVLAAVPVLIELFWALAAASVVLALFPLPGLGLFRSAVLLSAARGKTWQSRPAVLGRFKDMSVPHDWFWHFYVAGSFSNTLFLYLISWHWSSGGHLHNAAQLLPVHCITSLMFQAHLLRRLLESCFMLTSGRDDRMHTVAYVFGLSYYLVLPMTFVPDAWWMSFSRLNLPMDNVAEVPSYVSKYAEAAVIAVEQTQIVGFAIFLLGSVLQFLVHRQLSQLNPTAGAQAEGATPHVYKLPKGGLFEYVSCPHYFAEIIIYSGLLVTQAAKPALHLVMLWVVSNLALAAMETHRWYLKKFEDYPKHRKALIPFII